MLEGILNPESSGEINSRKIIHIDLDAFFCAVEEQKNPSLKNKPFAVGGSPTDRGVVTSCSYAARRFGIHSAMPMIQALRLYPQLIVIHGSYPDYTQASREVMSFLKSVTPLVEQISIDEAFLDVSDLPAPGREIAAQIQNAVFLRYKLPCSLGIATNKLVAKIATDVGKSQFKGAGFPNAMTEVPPGKEAEFLSPLPVRMLWGVGEKTSRKLTQLGVKTIGDLARQPEDVLTGRFGKHGRSMFRHAHGIDSSPVVVSRPVKSISQERTFSRDVCDVKVLQETLRGQSDKVARRLHRRNLYAKTIKIKIRWADFTTLTRQTTVANPVCSSDEICAIAGELFRKTWPAGKPVRLLGVGVSGLSKQPRQLYFWDPEGAKISHLHAALFDLKKRFGNQAVTFGMPELIEEDTER